MRLRHILSLTTFLLPVLPVLFSGCGKKTGPEPASAGVTAGEIPEHPDFAAHVRPIFNSNCVKCHGGVKHAGKYNIQFEEEAFKAGESGKIAIVPGFPEKSELMARITHHDSKERMPEGAPPLKPHQVEIVRRWIKDGAKWEGHWAYRKPADQPAPAVKNTSWPRNDTDRFLLARLEKEGLAPSPETDRATLLRRVFLDLTGLPPTPEEVDEFIADQSPDAYEKRVDKLLASNGFGERWTTPWLDIARYADTMGYEKDNHRDMWRYREWVVDALNRDMPFDQFTVEQLAGDLLPNATEDQIIATGFHRNTMNNTEGGTDNEEFRIAAVLDRVHVTFEAWQGVTMSCVQCHTHPYEPFMMDEHYKAMAFFNQTEDADKNDESPTLKTISLLERAKRDALQAEAVKLRAELKSSLANPLNQKDFDLWLAGLEKTVANPLMPISVTATDAAVYTVQPDGSLLASGPNPPRVKITVTAPLPAGKLSAIRLQTLPQKQFAGGAGRRIDGAFVLSEISASLETGGIDGSKPKSLAKLTLAKAAATFEQENRTATGSLPGQGAEGWGVFPRQTESHSAEFLLDKPLDVPPGARLVITLNHYYDEEQNQVYTLGAFRLSAHSYPVHAERFSLSPEAYSALLHPDRSPADLTALAQAFAPSNPALQSVRERIAKIEKELAAIKTTPLPVMRELPEKVRRKTNVFERGNFLTLGAEVSPDTPHSLNPFPKDQPRNRLGFARWLVSPENPLTARVAVNRFWEQIFGIGIVETTEDFGSTAEFPVHPELLDHLAVRFQGDMKWSVKKLLRELVTTAAYRQSSKATPDLLERDPANRLLARGPRFRLHAEAVRDQALAAAGLLSRKMFGPSVMPYQPEGVWSVVYNGANWKTSTGEDAYRRGLYTYHRRSSPYAANVNMDGVSREFCVPRRIRTNTPLQALGLLNDPAFFEAARALAARMVKEGGDQLDTRLKRGFRLVLLRQPTEADLAPLRETYRKALASYQADPKESAKVGATPEEAALALAANVILNLDETLAKP